MFFTVTVAIAKTFLDFIMKPLCNHCGPVVKPEEPANADVDTGASQ